MTLTHSYATKYKIAQREAAFLNTNGFSETEIKVWGICYNTKFIHR